MNVFLDNVCAYTNNFPVFVLINANVLTRLGHATSKMISFNYKSNRYTFFLNAIANSFAFSKDLSVP